MSNMKLISAAVITASFALASQAALAYNAGDVFVRGGVAQTDTGSGNGNLNGDSLNVQSARGFTFGAGYLFTDKVGVELNSSEKFEHDLNTSALGDVGSVDRLPINLLVNYYPMGGLDSKVQPYVGAGLNYTRFSGEPSGVNVDESYGAIGQVGVDLAVTDNIMLNGYASYADVNADINVGGEVDIEPVTIGGGVTYRF
ncbi:OmpW/AlkL family protein [Halomonas sp. AOP13-D3-9]|uniref:Outer membrane protein W n=1 Tax=Vreelandella olivaria TaxID=390919 RepID=A0ABM7GL88_9GAMM|nr:MULTISPECIES: OmpW family outer membrane protein [unclassified Halomonas]MBT2772479.1 outer membrane beta-barrel protein [Halomonas sp. ISL-60]MBT2802681.1 outer membrane beta-barrel protein [Halomonas sp. ISL-56]UZH08244.1 outer membrane beta-barrel protein [Halomonas sp. BDJS001]BBI51537.1 outer membrane protein W [Halomonas olivaria]